jgi:hypothetical protein
MTELNKRFRGTHSHYFDAQEHYAAAGMRCKCVPRSLIFTRTDDQPNYNNVDDKSLEPAAKASLVDAIKMRNWECTRILAQTLAISA